VHSDGVAQTVGEGRVGGSQGLRIRRGLNSGSGVGLGLSIVADIARSHGGVLRLGESKAMGGLKAELVLAR
jgi:two-component system osmolarity sensor histidine kinase EnvZ